MNVRRAPPDVSGEHQRRLDAARPLARAAVCVGAVTLGAGLAVLLLDGWEIGPLAIVLAGIIVLTFLSVPIRRARLCPGCGKPLRLESGLFCPICGARISRLDLEEAPDGSKEHDR